jgi:MFS family permease
VASPEPAEAAFRTEVRRHLRRNYAAHLAHGLLGQTGMRLVNAPTFVPVYVELLAGSSLAVGVARGLQYLGMFLSPVVGATAIEHRRRVLPVGFLIGALMRVQVLGLALGGLLLPDPWALLSACAFLGFFGVFLGVQGVVFSFLVSKVIPVEKRGVLLGLRNALAGLTATGVAVVAGSLVERNALGDGFAATFLLAFALTSMGLLMLLFVREPESPSVREPSRVLRRLRELPALLRDDRSFTRYFVARALATMGRMGLPFYILFARETIGVTGERLGLLTGAFVLVQSVGNLFWGALADRRGFRAIFLVALSVWILAVLLLMEATSFESLLVVYAALGAGLGGFQLSAQNLVLEFGARDDLPMRIAVANSASELVASIGAVLGGVLVAAFSYLPVFWTAIAFQLTALALVIWGVDEPRRPRPGARGAGLSPRRRLP